MSRRIERKFAFRIDKVLFYGVTLLGALITLAPKALAEDKGWIFTQRSTQMGDQYVYVSPAGIKVVSPKLSCNIVTTAPNWDVTFYNDKTRTFYVTTFEKWQREIQEHAGARDLTAQNWNRGTASQIAGMRASQYVIQPGNNSAARRKGVKEAECWVADEVRVPYQISEMISRAYGLPNTSSFPLRISVVEGGANKQQLDTYRAQAYAIPASYFGVPQGYTRVESKAEVMLDDEAKQMLNDLASDSPSINSSAPRQQQQAQPVRQYQRQQQYAGGQQQYAGQQAQSGETVDIYGYKIDKEKARRLVEQLKKNSQQGTAGGASK